MLGCISFVGAKEAMLIWKLLAMVAEELTPLLGEVQLPPLSGDYAL